ncbi:hypothetical protein PR202_ga03514 [Eleusine coracana subsp. coracana]|uniref:Coilin N-terminal domain-containing protein n=1 Tax=Eleusine coracana subsp. coracana TaxID=191504 RepID=A0AAV5BQK3_ELECO|nr:hypothetical protein PR202_ga03514 [Eleusine coracana subsp. coracana]
MATPPAAAPPPVRLRLVFDSRRLLRRAQRDEGLRRCWLLLRSELATVAELAAHVADHFRLDRSCPHGVILSMDGFTLPPFESTNIFRDRDVVRVKQKSWKNMIKHDDVDYVQDPMVVEKQPLPTDDKILAIEYKKDENKNQEEQGGHQHHENATISHNIESIDTRSKRKCRDGDAGIPESSRKKKLKVMNLEKAIGVSKEDNVYQYKDQNRSENLMSSSNDIITEEATPEAETTGVLGGKQKTERYDLKSCT